MEYAVDGTNGLVGGLIGVGGMALSAGIILASLCVAFFWYIIRAVGYWKVFGKAGEAGWKAIVPFYNTYTRYSLSWDAKMFWISLVLVIASAVIPNTGFLFATLRAAAAIAYLVVNVMSYHRLSTCFGHGAGFTVGLFLLEPIFALILGVNDSKYLGKDA